MEKAAKRREAMRAYKAQGLSLAAIGRRYGVSWQRVQQILDVGKPK